MKHGDWYYNQPIRMYETYISLRQSTLSWVWYFTIQYTLHNPKMKNPGKLGRIIPKSDYREREKWPRHTVYKALPMGDIGGFRGYTAYTDHSNGCETFRFIEKLFNFNDILFSLYFQAQNMPFLWVCFLQKDRWRPLMTSRNIITKQWLWNIQIYRKAI